MHRNTIHLHGIMKKRFGGPFTLAVKTPAHALNALMLQKPGFREALDAGHWRVVRGPLKGGRRLHPDEFGVNLPGEMHLVAAAAGSKNGAVGKIVIAAVLIAITIVSWGTAAPATVPALAAEGAAATATVGGSALAGTAAAGAGAAGAGAAGAGAAGIVGGGAAFGTGVLGTSVAGLGLGITNAQMALFGASLLFAGVSQLLSPMPKAGAGSSQDTKPSYLFNGSLSGTDQGTAIPIGFGEGRIPGIIISLGIDVEALPT